MQLPPDLLRLTSKEGARRLALGHLKTAAPLRDRLADPSDPEGLHDFRVAIRRLRSCLRAYEPEIRSTVRKKTLRQLERVADATRESRDLQAHLSWLKDQREQLPTEAQPGLAWLTSRLEQERVGAWDEMMKEIDATCPAMAQRLNDELMSFRTTVRLDDTQQRKSMARVTSDRLADAAARLRRRLSQVHQISDEEPIHRARIAAKRLRYLLDPFAEGLDEGPVVVDRLKELQDAFGDVHDVHVFTGILVEALSEATKLDLESAESGREPLVPGLTAVEAALRERGKKAFARAKSAWLGNAAKAFLESVGRIGKAIGTSQPGQDQEIERKFLLDALPAFDQADSIAEIEQGYLPGERLVERLRRVTTDNNEELVRTMKEGTGMTRLEIEEPVSPDLFARLWPLTEGRQIRKRRHRVKDGDLTWEIDEFRDRSLVLAEVELTSPSDEVTPPDWLRPHIVREVTDDAEYSNYRLACQSAKTEHAADARPAKKSGAGDRGARTRGPGLPDRHATGVSPP
jgi:CHAD domain-containing protein/CYTH domain-containing protein